MSRIPRLQRSWSLSDESEAADGAELEPEPEDLDWDNYSVTLEEKINVVCIPFHLWIPLSQQLLFRPASVKEWVCCLKPL